MKRAMITILCISLSATAFAADAMDRQTRAKEIGNLHFGMFVCWSLSTFSGYEWTRGKTTPDAFTATGCDTDQWCQAAKDAGMGYILFLTKHHDGFCLWDTKTTEFKVTNSALKMDVLAALRKSCDKYGLKLALYFSEGDWTWVKDPPQDGLIPGSPNWGNKVWSSSDNPEVKKEQLKELTTQYGPIEFFWMDHAQGTGGLGHKETDEWVRSFQPNCFVGFNHGDPAGELCIREVGRPGPIGAAEASEFNKEAEKNYKGYLLAEFTYPILPKHDGGAMWFYSLPMHDRLAAPAQPIYDDYVGAVKYGNIFSLDVGPDYAGRLRDADVKTLHEVGEKIRAAKTAAPEPAAKEVLWLYEPSAQGTPAAYDEAMAAACLQGIINRDAPRVYVRPASNVRTAYWLNLFSKDNGWLAGREQQRLADLDALEALAGDRVKGAVIWDPAVPATINVATTIAGVKDGVVLSPELADQYLAKWKLPVIEDLRGRFTGAESGSKKNDAYRWAVREYLAKGLCSDHLLCLFEDSATSRAAGGVSYVVTRDWAVENRSFVFDLSPWGDEKPKDDPDQPMGTDLATYNRILEETLKRSAGKCMTEMTGFFSFWKYSNMPGYASKHEPVPTEWETVYLITPYNCYQNTVSSDCYNQSFHSQAPFKPLKQSRPAPVGAVEDKAYVCFLMADYDSVTPLYDFMPKNWDDPNRGKLPLAWGINPNLLETYPDIIMHLYQTATPNDHFTSDASCAGYFNPNRVKPEYLPLFVRHNKHFFDLTDMTVAPMVLDWDQPTPAVKDAFTQFAPDGYATIITDLHNTGGVTPKPHVWKGMPVAELLNHTCNYASPKQTADAMYAAMKERGVKHPGFYFYRIVWVSPTSVLDSLDVFRKEHPDVPIEVVDPYSFFALFAKHYRDAIP